MSRGDPPDIRRLDMKPLIGCGAKGRRTLRGRLRELTHLFACLKGQGEFVSYHRRRWAGSRAGAMELAAGGENTVGCAEGPRAPSSPMGASSSRKAAAAYGLPQCLTVSAARQAGCGSGARSGSVKRSRLACHRTAPGSWHSKAPSSPRLPGAIWPACLLADWSSRRHE